MGMKPQSFSEVPENTAQLVRKSRRFKKNRYVLMRQLLGVLFRDEQFAALYTSSRGRPAEAPAILAMVLVLQFIEDLDDEAAAEAVLTRIDWKYLLGLALEDEGFDPSVLSEFRDRVVEGDLVDLFMKQVLKIADTAGLLGKRGQQRTDSTHVIGHVRQLNRLECVVQALQSALNSLSVVATAWLLDWVPNAWFEQYDDLLEGYDFPKKPQQRKAFTLQVGEDCMTLLKKCYAPEAPSYLREIPAVEILRQIVVQQYYVVDTRRGQRISWRKADELPPHAQVICSPHEIEVRYSTKRTTSWSGYKVHLTETCDPDAPRLITHVVTTPATTDDEAVVGEIHADLAAQGLLPAEHLLDAGYTSAGTLLASQRDYGVAMIAPVPPDSAWQARTEGGYTLAMFDIDWDAGVVTCPQSVTSTCWSESIAKNGTPVIHVRFPRAECSSCPAREQCTRAKKDGRTLTFLRQEEYVTLQTRRQEQETPEFWEQAKTRAGIEGTLSQGVRAFGLRRARYRGESKTHLQHTLIAAGMDLIRMVNWLRGDRPRGTRTTRFAQLGALRAAAGAA
jgi:transposase